MGEQDVGKHDQKKKVVGMTAKDVLLVLLIVLVVIRAYLLYHA
jgi:hypothetical protein